MTTTHSPYAGPHIIHIKGDLDAAQVSTLKPKFQRELSSLKNKSVELDLSNTQFIDSAGVGLLVLIYKTLQKQGTAFVITGLQPQPLQILTMLKMDELLTMTPIAK